MRATHPRRASTTMSVNLRLPLALALVSALACDVPGAPTWSADLLLPLDYPDIVLSDYAVAGAVPDTDITFLTPIASQDVSGLTDQIFAENLNAISGELIYGTTINVTGTITATVAAQPTDLFSTDPARAVTVRLPFAAGTDTVTVTADTALFHNAAVLYFQSSVTVRGAPGGTPVSPTDRVTVDLNVIANVQISK
jgi:hypothetical protein